MFRQECEHAAGAGYAGRGQVDRPQGDAGRGADQLSDRAEASWRKRELHGEITEIPPEGSLLPDTYRFGGNDTRQTSLSACRPRIRSFSPKMWETRDPEIVVTTPEEAVILASIVEKETGRADERPLIASVFENRLRRRCGCNPTRPSSTDWWAERARSIIPSNKKSSTARRRITPIRSMACRQPRSTIRAAPRSRRCCGRPNQRPLFRRRRDRRPRLRGLARRAQ